MLNLSKGQKIDLVKEDGTELNTLTATVTWEAGSVASDVDVSVVFMGEDGKRRSGDSGIMYYNNLDTAPHSGVTHSGDDQSGGTGETVTMNLPEVSADVAKMAIVVTSYAKEGPSVNFGQMSVPVITISDDGGTDLFKFELDEDASLATALDCGEVYRRNGTWKFNAAGTVLGSSQNGLEDVLSHFAE